MQQSLCFQQHAAALRAGLLQIDLEYAFVLYIMPKLRPSVVMYLRHVRSDNHVPCAANCHVFVATPAVGSVCWQPRLIRPYVLVAAPVHTQSRVQWPVVCLQHSQACSGTGYSASEPVHWTPNHRLQSMLKTLIPELQMCADILLDLNVWNDEQKWKNKNADKFKNDDFVGPFWNVSVDHRDSTDKIAIFHKSLKNMVKIMVDVIQYQKDSSTQDTSDPTSKHTDQWGSLKRHLTDLPLTLHEYVRNPSNGWLTNVVTFSMLTHETTWENWIQGCIHDDRVYKIWHFFAKRMASFCIFFVEILDELSTNKENWTTCVEKILDFCRDAVWGTDILDKLRKVDNMSEKNLRKFVQEIQNTLEIPFWLRIDAENLELEKVKRFAKDLLIAPCTGELEKLYEMDHGGLIMCIHAMEDQNNVPEADRKKIDTSFLRDKEQLIKYAMKHKPFPIFADLETMDRGTLEATVIQMLRHLCMLATELPNLEELSVDELVSYGETLLTKYPREKFPSPCDPCGPALIRRLASVVHLPDNTLEMILAMSTDTQNQRFHRYKEVEKLESSYQQILFYSRTASRLGVNLWSSLEKYTIHLQTGICNKEPEGTLDLTICQNTSNGNEMTRNPRVRFFLQTASQQFTTYRNVTQFMEVIFGYQEDYCILIVYDPVRESSRTKENTQQQIRYYIPNYHTTDPSINQKKALQDFLSECATKIGQPKPLKTIAQNLNEQMYRACDPIHRKQRIARQVLLQVFDGKEDVANQIMAYTKNTH